MPKTSKNQLGETYYPLTEEEAREWYRLKYLNTTGYLLIIKRLFTKPDADFVITNVIKFCKEWEITKSSFYRAVNALSSDGKISWEATEGLVLKSSQKVVTIPRAGHCPTSGTLSHERDADSHERDADSHERDADSHERDADIYIDRAHDRSYSDLNTDLIQIPPTPQGSDDDSSSLKTSIPIQSPSQPNSIPPTKPNLESKVPARDNNPSRNGRVRGVTLATRDGVPEVRVSVQGTYGLPKEDFFGADKPWSELAGEVDATPKEIHALAQRWIAERCGDKKDPKAYASVILNGLAKDPNSKFNALLWQQFEDAVHDQGVDELIVALQVKEASQMPKDGFHAHPCKNEWLEALRSRKMDFVAFVLAGKTDGTSKVREAFYGWCLEKNLITTGWDK